MFSKFHKLFDALHERERQIFQSASIVFLLSFFLNGANLFYKATVLSPIEGGSYTEAVVGQPIAINPLLMGQNEVDRDLIPLLFSPLKDLSESIEVNDDKRTWTVTLPTDLYWSDGKPLTTDDIIFTLQTIQNPDATSPLMNAWQGVSTERVSAEVVRIVLKTPYAFFGENLEWLYIVPEHIFGAIPAANLRLSDYNLEPVGSGPYMFSQYTKRKDGFITLYHFGTNPHFRGNAALIKNFSFAFFGSYTEAIKAFNRREVDGLGGMSPEEEQNLIKVAHEVHEISIPRYYAVFFNPAASIELKEVAVRRALAKGVNKKELVDEALLGKGITIDGPLHPQLEGYDPGALSSLSYDEEAAKELLDNAGWKIGDDGIREKAFGKDTRRLSFQMIVPDIDFLKQTGELIKSEWKNLGVDIELVTLSPIEITNEVIKNRNYTMLLFGNILKETPDIFSFWHSSERFRSGLNLAFYENKSVDALLESVRREFGTDARRNMLSSIQEKITADAPAVFLFSPSYLYAGPRTLGGFDERFMESPSRRFENIEEWYLKTARVFK